MREWNDNFDMKRSVNGENIIVGQQDFINGTILIKDNNKVIELPMFSDKNGNIYFIYNKVGVYVSEYLGEFKIK